MSKIHGLLSEAKRIESREVAEENRLKALPRHFGRLMLTVESRIFAHLKEICPAYKGAYWRFFELSNAGFYMAPALEGSLDIEVHTNYYSGKMSADAAGITACLFAFGDLAFEHEELADYFHALRAFAGEHAEAGEIFQAID